MKELLREAICKDYEKSIYDYLYGIGFSKSDADGYVQFCERTMKEDILIEQIFERIIPQTLKEVPELARELNAIPNIKELAYSEQYLGGGNQPKEFIVRESCGCVTIIRNKNKY